MIKTLYWHKGKLYLLNQLLLPSRVRYVACARYAQVVRAIRDMVVRGAPAIGVAAAFGVALAAREKKFRSYHELREHVEDAVDALAGTRPTAVNLFWALERMKACLLDEAGSAPAAAALRLEHEAQAVMDEDIAVNRAIGDNGARLLRKNSVVLTHCNAGALATAGYGTALGVVRSAHAQGKIKMVYVDETRPYLQGARLTAWELRQEKVPYCLITDSMAGHFMKTDAVSAVIVGADRIAANGDTANKIGTYSLSILAAYHRIPLYVAAPTSTIDAATKTGDGIVIEERSAREVLYVNRLCIAPAGTTARHPGFDVTPAKNIAAIVTEKGVFKPADILKALGGNA